MRRADIALNGEELLDLLQLRLCRTPVLADLVLLGEDTRLGDLRLGPLPLLGSLRACCCRTST